MNIINLYYPFSYLFYRWYRFNQLLFKKKRVDSFIVVAAVSSFQIINLLSVVFVYESKYGDGVLMIERKQSTIFVLLILAFNSLIFLTQGRVNKIMKKFSSETERQKKTGIFITWVYIIATYIIFFYTISLD